MKEKKPNIIYILSDDLGYGDYDMHISTVAHNRVFTPNINRMADMGMRFPTTYTGPSCTPSRSLLMTGLHLGHAR